MRSGALLMVVAGTAVINGLSLDHPIPAWRQLLFLVLAVAAYLHGRHRPGRRDRLLLAAAAASAAAWAARAFPDGAGALVALGLFVTLPWLAGRFRHQQAGLVRAGTQRVAQLEREQAFVAEQARLRERARIASEMHDALGHDLALIALRAGALELAGDLAESHRDAVAGLRASAVAATDRLRHTVRLLRSGDAGRTPVPAESLDALLEQARDAGMTVHLHEGQTTSPGAAGQTVHAAGAVHRVVQEALTNAARHAPGAEVDVRVERTGDAVTVTVYNLITPGRPPPRSSGGTGIAGLRRHVSSLGGTLHAHTTHDAFTVTARLPTRQPAGAPTERDAQ